jgi:hypothetical protein
MFARSPAMLSPQSLCPGLAKKTIGWGEAPQPAWPGRRFLAADAGPHAAPSLCPSSRVISTHFDRVAFKVVRIYATLAADGRTANLKFKPDEQEFRCMMAPEAFAPVPNAWASKAGLPSTCPSSAPRSSRTHSKRRGRMLCRRDAGAGESSGNLRRWQSAPVLSLASARDGRSRSPLYHRRRYTARPAPQK